MAWDRLRLPRNWQNRVDSIGFRTCPRMTMNAAQRKIVNLLKTFFFAHQFSLVFVYLICGLRQRFFFQCGPDMLKVGHPWCREFPWLPPPASPAMMITSHIALVQCQNQELDFGTMPHSICGYYQCVHAPLIYACTHSPTTFYPGCRWRAAITLGIQNGSALQRNHLGLPCDSCMLPLTPAPGSHWSILPHCNFVTLNMLYQWIIQHVTFSIR